MTKQLSFGIGGIYLMSKIVKIALHYSKSALMEIVNFVFITNVSIFMTMQAGGGGLCNGDGDVDGIR